jgi:hypothetical protein
MTRPRAIRFGSNAVSLRSGRLLVVALALVAPALAACARTIAPLRGAPASPSAIPRIELSGSRQIVFRWEYNEEAIVARGEGVARLAAPDSARIDFFVDGGFGGGYALLFGDRVVVPGGDLIRNMLPSTPMLWAAVGRVAVPPAADTVATVDAGILRADIGREPRWRLAFAGGRLTSLERVEEGHVSESLSRAPDGTIRYLNPRGRRMLRITITREETVPGFDASIWRP